jgi:hypothetical protein
MIVNVITTAVVALLLGGCSVLADLPARGQTQWDPKPGQSLIDQIPNNTNSADVCAGHIRPEQRKPWQTDRC